MCPIKKLTRNCNQSPILYKNDTFLINIQCDDTLNNIIQSNVCSINISSKYADHSAMNNDDDATFQFIFILKKINKEDRPH